jgi:PQQ-dependent catabolism-associated CXXCW motif protein
LPAGTLWRPKPRLDLPGSIWLPDTGYGALAPQVERYFFDALARASGGDKTKPILLYCQRDCWMSWNAAKRALQAGYTNVIWYPEGTEGWSEENYPLEERRPEPRE